MADTIREQILNRLVMVLESIQEGVDYVNTIVEVKRFGIKGMNPSYTPSVGFQMVSEDDNTSIYPAIESTMTIRLEIWEQMEDEDILDTTMGTLMADVQKAIMNDPQLNSLAHYTRIKNRAVVVSEDEVFGVAIMALEVKYSYQATDPTAAVNETGAVNPSVSALWDTIRTIEREFADQIKAGAITGVNGIVINNEVYDGDIRPPYIRIFLEESPVDDEGVSIHEYWKLQITVMAVTDSYASADADLVRALALKASTLIITDRTLNVRVQDTVRTSYAPDYKLELPSGGAVFGAAVMHEVRLINREV